MQGELFYNVSEQVEIFYFNVLQGLGWTSSPSDFVDNDWSGADGSAAQMGLDSRTRDWSNVTQNTCPTGTMRLSKVELRTRGYKNDLIPSTIQMHMHPKYSAGYGEWINWTPPSSVHIDWSIWYNITGDTNAPAIWNLSEVNAIDCDVYAANLDQPADFLGAFGIQLRVTYLNESFIVTRDVSDIAETNNFSFTPSFNNGSILKIPVSSNVRGIIDVTNNTAGGLATEVNSTSELVNDTFWYDATNQYVYIRTINITCVMVVNWTVNCSYGAIFNLIIPPYLEVGQYFHSSGFISDIDGNAISGMIAETRLLQNGVDMLPANPKHNCTDGTYTCTFATTTLSPGIYDASIEFTDPDSGITFKEGGTLYLSVDPGPGIYVSTFLHFTFYNSNTGTGLPSESLKIYASTDTTISSNDRIYIDSFRVYTGQTIYYRIDDYFDNQIYPSSGDHETLNITSIDQKEDIPIDWFDIAIKNLNYTILRFSMENGSRYYNATLFPMDPFHFFILPGDYNITKRYYNPFNGTYIRTEYDEISITSDDFYIASGFGAIVHISWYNTNEALGLPDETLKLYVNGMRKIEKTFYTYINSTINVTVKDYYNSTLYSSDVAITSQYMFLDLGLTFHSWLFGNMNNIHYIISILKQGGNRWWERGIVPYGEREFMIPSGVYALRIYYNDSGTISEIYNSSLPPSTSVVNSKVYVLEGAALNEIIAGQSVIEGLLEERREKYSYPGGNGVYDNRSSIIPVKPPVYPDDPFTVSEMYDVLRVTSMPKSDVEITVVFLDTGFSPRTYDNVDLSNIIADKLSEYSTAYDRHGHGTWTSYALASIFATHLPNVRLISFKVFDNTGSCTNEQLIEAFDLIKKLNPDVVSFSGGGYGSPFDALSKKVEELRNSGVVVVVAAGNYGPDSATILSPSCSEAAICVGAIDPKNTLLDRSDDIVTTWSSRGPVVNIKPKPDFTSPGESIIGPWMSGEVAVSGTSMATPLVAAGMAIMCGNNKGILDFVDILYFWDGGTVPNILEGAMVDTAFKKGSVDDYGWGIIDFDKANDAVYGKAVILIIIWFAIIIGIIVAVILAKRYILHKGTHDKWRHLNKKR